MRYFINTTGFPADKVEITKKEDRLIDKGGIILWWDNSMYHIWPSSRRGNGKHILSFEVKP